jgi:hypothetical protein
MKEIRAIIKVNPSSVVNTLPVFNNRYPMNEDSIPMCIRYDHHNTHLIVPVYDRGYVKGESEANVIITSDVNYMMKYHNMEIEVNYVGLSRIDGYPIFHVNTAQLSREEKIDKLLQI